jgi:hypothetical protein
MFPAAPPAVIGKPASVGTHAATYKPVPCAELAAAVPKPAGAMSAWYGALMTEALHRHGFDASWPHVPALVIGKAVSDWTNCFVPEKTTKPPSK